MTSGVTTASSTSSAANTQSGAGFMQALSDAADWAGDALKGEFKEDRSMGQVAFDAAVTTLNPVAGVAAAGRDLTAIEERAAKNGGYSWGDRFAQGTAVLGAVPIVGGVVKVVAGGAKVLAAGAHVAAVAGTGTKMAMVAGTVVKSGEKLVAEAASEAVIHLPGLARPVRAASAAFPPDKAIVEAMNSTAMQKMANKQWYHNTDCSEIAEALQRMSGGKGQIIEAQPVKRGTLSTAAYGEIDPGQVYHQVLTDGRYVFDPRLASQPIPKGDWEAHMRAINPDGVIFSNKPKGF